jgi:hypothetical protein
MLLIVRVSCLMTVFVARLLYLTLTWFLLRIVRNRYRCMSVLHNRKQALWVTQSLMQAIGRVCPVITVTSMYHTHVYIIDDNMITCTYNDLQSYIMRLFLLMYNYLHHSCMLLFTWLHRVCK